MKDHSIKQIYHIAFVYLAIGKYDILWDKFYCSCEQFLFPDAEKYYFVFTDSKKLLNVDLLNVSTFFRKDGGWALNALAKYDCMLEIRNQLEAFDYLFYINANYQILTPVWCDEILATGTNDFLSVLSFDFLAEKHPDDYTYDRNPLCVHIFPMGQEIVTIKLVFMEEEFLKCWIWQHGVQNQPVLIYLMA